MYRGAAHALLFVGMARGPIPGARLRTLQCDRNKPAPAHPPQPAPFARWHFFLLSSGIHQWSTWANAILDPEHA